MKNPYVVSENCKIILDGDLYLLQEGDQIIIEDQDIVNFSWSCPSPPELDSFTFADPSDDPGDYTGMVDYITEHGKEIEYEDFEQAVGGEDKILEALGDLSRVYDEDFKIKDDWAVTWHKSIYPDGRVIYYLQHSGIEYVFD